MSLADAIRVELSQASPGDALPHVGPSILAALPLRPREILEFSHLKLYAYHFSEVPTCWRRCFEEASLLLVAGLLSECEGDIDETQRSEAYDEVIRLLDNTIIVAGAPGRRRLIDAILHALDDDGVDDNIPEQAHADSDELPDQPPTKKQKTQGACQNVGNDPAVYHFFNSDTQLSIRLVHSVPKISNPSILTFQNHVQRHTTPVILQNTIAHWPALHRWRSPQYWLQRTHNGRRLVPVELGRSYTDDGWSQRIMPLSQFMRDHLLPSESLDHQDRRQHVTGYMAQHDLLAQVPALKDDILVPDYCYVNTTPLREDQAALLNEDSSVRERPSTSVHNIRTTAAHPEDSRDIYAHDQSDSSDDDSGPICNLWLGPAGTVSPAHTDPHHNLLTQVVGRKYVRLYSPRHSAAMYPMNRSGEIDMANTSRVDVGLALDWADMAGNPAETVREQARSQQSELFPDFEKIDDFVEAILEPGDVLYIPKGWWHYVQSIDISASVSFWWD